MRGMTSPLRSTTENDSDVRVNDGGDSANIGADVKGNASVPRTTVHVAGSKATSALINNQIRRPTSLHIARVWQHGRVDIQQRLLVIADIGGYTKFMVATRVSLIHAQQAITSLMEAVLDGATGLELAKLEGDAAFFHAPASHVDVLPNEVAEIRRRFVQRRDQLSNDAMCTCGACVNLKGLTLKFVAHQGEVAIHKVRDREELAGVDVILVHRLLKNTVPIKEYVLVSDAVKHVLPEEHVQAAEEDLEGIGNTAVHWVPTDAIADTPPPAPKTPTATRWWRKIGKEVSMMLSFIGLKKGPQLNNVT